MVPAGGWDGPEQELKASEHEETRLPAGLTIGEVYDCNWEGTSLPVVCWGLLFCFLIFDVEDGAQALCLNTKYMVLILSEADPKLGIAGA